jgi:magnesium chelatase subunit D
LSFTDVVGQEEAKQALLLAAIEPLLGGVLLRGDKGSAKTTLARGMAALLADDAPFVELPLGASEERVIGSIDVAQLLDNAQARFHPGLLAAAHGGVLYVDEINLLADHLVDALLDAAASGVNRVERDGISHSHPARFVLVASMNPEEGELRPQLLDRFGLAVDITTSVDPVERALAVRLQLDAERSTAVRTSGDPEEQALRHHLAAARARRPHIGDEIIAIASRLAVAVGAEGLRADLMLCRAASAAAALDGDGAVTAEHVRSVAAAVLAHRRRRRPFDQPGIDAEELEQAWTDAMSPPASQPDQRSEEQDEPGTERTAGVPFVPTATAPRPSTSGKFANGSATRGRKVRSQPFDPALGVDVHATALAVAGRRAAGRRAAGDDRSQVSPASDVPAADLRSAQRRQRQGSLVVFVLDTSASMGVEHRMKATKSAVLGMLADAYRRRGRVALVVFHHEQADVVLRPTASVEIANARLVDMPTGGTTPLAAGLDAARRLVESQRAEEVSTHVVVITDGRATHGDGDPVAAAHAAGEQLRRAATTVAVVDTEAPGPPRLGLARQLATAIGAEYRHLDDLDGPTLESAARNLTVGPPAHE